jgi:hypothetical protein
LITFGIMLLYRVIVLYFNPRCCRPVVVLLVLMLTSCYAYSQQATGFYFTVECSKYTQKPKPVTLAEKKMTVCVTAQPVVTIDEFEAISDLFEIKEQNFSFFDVTLSSKAHETLKKIGATFAFNHLVFLIDDEVVFLFEVEIANPTRVFRITDSYHSRDIQRIYSKLKTLTIKE